MAKRIGKRMGSKKQNNAKFFKKCEERGKPVNKVYKRFCSHKCEERWNILKPQKTRAR